ncbi:DUF4148 domain-containing protein [Achromobacter aloeverae]|uniref:DUF4148 domain-containing protein n=1 Tax=Achromobacter aloeverae TaxID=1750518 RepID=A0A4Q1HHZ6_9BURK|nr:DUF4148 domain-containing protein [Achromobacter aloeverae]RXN86581.1 hypothetical protein C7R54_16705 [Achromobacter aloeverae]
MRIQTIATSAALVLALVGIAHAGTPLGDPDNTPFQGAYGQSDNASASRAQVQAELQQAKAEGLVARGDLNNVPFAAQADSGVSRTQVAADVAQTPGATAFGDPDNVPFQGA